MDPRQFFKRVAKQLGLMKREAESANEVSSPTNFEHRVHVDLDGSGQFVGLPPQWRRVVGRGMNRAPSPELSRSAFKRENANNSWKYPTPTDGTLNTSSRTNAERYATLAASLETPRLRASVADSQDLIIERLKRELRDYKARNSGDFEESVEDIFRAMARHSSSAISARTSPMKRLPVKQGNVNGAFSSSSSPSTSSVPDGLDSKKHTATLKRSESEVWVLKPCWFIVVSIASSAVITTAEEQ